MTTPMSSPREITDQHVIPHQQKGLSVINSDEVKAVFHDLVDKITRKVDYCNQTDQCWEFENALREDASTVILPTEAEMITARQELEKVLHSAEELHVKESHGEISIEVNIGKHIASCIEEALLDMKRPGFGTYVGQEYGHVRHYVDSLITDLPRYIGHGLWDRMMYASEHHQLNDMQEKYEDPAVVNIFIEEMIEDFLSLKMVPVQDWDSNIHRAYYERSAGFAEGSRDFLGQGGYGEVFLATVYEENDHYDFVVKRANEYGYPALLHEFGVFLDLHSDPQASQFLVGFRGASSGETYLAMEQLLPLIKYAQPEMLAYLSDQEVSEDYWFFDEDQLDNLFEHLHRGLIYLHERGYAHGDIKPANIGMGAEDTLPKFMDLGGMVHAHHINKEDMDARVGVTQGYGFQEVVDEVIETRDISVMQDMDWYALGQVFLEITAMGIGVKKRLGLEGYSDEFLDDITTMAKEWTMPMKGYIHRDQYSLQSSEKLFSYRNVLALEQSKNSGKVRNIE